MSRGTGVLPDAPVVKDRGSQKVNDQMSICDATTETISLATICPEAIDGSRGESELLSSSASQTFVVTAVVSGLYNSQTVEDFAAETDLEPGAPAENVKLDAKRSDTGRPEPSAPGDCSLERGVAARQPGVYSVELDGKRSRSFERQYNTCEDGDDVPRPNTARPQGGA